LRGDFGRDPQICTQFNDGWLPLLRPHMKDRHGQYAASQKAHPPQ